MEDEVNRNFSQTLSHDSRGQRGCVVRDNSTSTAKSNISATCAVFVDRETLNQERGEAKYHQQNGNSLLGFDDIAVIKCIELPTVSDASIKFYPDSSKDRYLRGLSGPIDARCLSDSSKLAKI